MLPASGVGESGTTLKGLDLSSTKDQLVVVLACLTPIALPTHPNHSERWHPPVVLVGLIAELADTVAVERLVPAEIFLRRLVPLSR